MKRIVSIFIFLLSCLALNAQALPSLLIPADSRSLSLAGSDVALDRFGQNGGAEFYYNSWAPESAGNKYMGGQLSIGLGDTFRIGFDGRYCKSDSMDVTSDVGVVKSSSSPSELFAGLNAFFFLPSGLSFGAEGRFLRSVLYEKASGSAIAADVHIKYAVESLKAGISLCNLGTKINYGGDDHSLPALVKAGAAYEIAGVTACAEADYLFSGGIMFGVGAEYSFKDMAFVRAGYHYGEALPSFMSLGAGLQFKGVQLNANYLLASDTLGGSMSFGLGFRF